MSVTASNYYRPAEEVVAIVGAGCRLPEANSVDQFWDLLVAARDVVTEIPLDRFDARGLYSAEMGKPNTIRSLSGGFIDQIDCFDADFFGIPPSEAEQLDPQQRLLLEVAWHAVEDAGLPLDTLAGSNTGVYLSVFNSGYWDLLRKAGRYTMHAAMGGDTAGMSAGRVAYHLDLRGPAMSVEASCASSLVAVHTAARALRCGEIDRAIVGAANVVLSPDMYLVLSEADMLSATGRCRFGDERADGYVRSEGAVAVVLERLSDAVRDGDRVYATVLGSAVRNDGRTGGTQTAPGVTSQEELLRAAYRDAGVRPADVDFVETHGAGTAVGDPVELAALANVLGESRSAELPCLVGSAKSNVGHLENAAGMVGLLKAALALHHRQLPATLHVTRPVEPLAEPGSPLRLATRTAPLTAESALAGVSAFGLSGTNAHVVLAEGPTPTSTPVSAPGPTSAEPGAAATAHLLPVSAKSAAALRQWAADLADMAADAAIGNLADICHSAGVRRTHHEVRAAVVARTRGDLVTGLSAIAEGVAVGDGWAVADAPVTQRPRTVFVFPGQGSQWVGMGRELWHADAAFRETLTECDRAVRRELGWSPLERLFDRVEMSTVDVWR